MKTTITAIVLLSAAAAAQAQDLCPKGAEFLQSLRQTGMREADVARFTGTAQELCSQPKAPTTAEEYKRQQQAEHQRRVNEMKATPEKQPIRLW